MTEDNKFVLRPSSLTELSDNPFLWYKKHILNESTFNGNHNTVLGTYQEVYDFLISYGRWLVSQGWTFDTYDSDTGNVLNWNQSAKEFLMWAQGSWQNGTLIALSPCATSTTFTANSGMIQYVNGIISGTYPVVDRSGTNIQSYNLNIIRDDKTLTIQPTNGNLKSELFPKNLTARPFS